jgi:hypothetical protein
VMHLSMIWTILTIDTYSTLHSVGAAIILLTLPLDLFFQQIVAYPTVWVSTTYPAPVARATYYEPPASFDTFNHTTYLVGDPTLYGIEQAYILRDPIDYNYNPGCPTSNCTWEPLDTLAVCSSCVDASSIIESGCQIASGDWLPTVQTYQSIAPNVSSCGWFFNPVGGPPRLLTGYWTNEAGEPQDGLATTMLPLSDVNTHANLVPGGTLNFPHIQNPLIDFLVVASPNGLAGAYDYKNNKPSAYECEFHWCVKSVTPSFAFGKFTENVTQEVQLNTNNVDDPWREVTDDEGVLHEYYLPQFNLTLPDKTSPTGQTLFGMNNLTAHVSEIPFTALIPSWWQAENATAPLSVKWNTAFDTPDMNDGRNNPWGVTPDIPDLVTRFASSVSSVLRTTKSITTNQLNVVNGTAWKQETHVLLKWEWVTLPLSLLLFSLVFLISTVIQSSKEQSKIGVWKTSALAVLFNGLGEEIQETLGPRVRVGDARARAKKLSVHLDD